MATIYNANTMSKADIKRMQQALIDQGYNLGPSGADGIWGSKTTSAVSKYKKDTGGSNTYGTTVGNETLNKLYGKTTIKGSATQSKGSSKGSSYQPTSYGGSTQKPKGNTGTSTSFVDKKTKTSADRYVNDYSELAKGFNAAVNDRIAAAQSKGLKVYSAYDSNGVLHYTTKGKDKLNSILSYYNNSKNPTYDIGGVNYVLEKQKAPTVKTVNSKNGNRNATLTYRSDGTVDVTFESPTYSTVGDYIQENDNTFIFYVSDPENGTYWMKGTPDQYYQYVKEYEANYGQDEEFLAMQRQIAQMQEELLQRTQEANRAGVDKSVQEIQSQLENGIGKYGQDAAEAYLQKLRAQQSQQLQNAYQGDLGGIGNKQYNEASASYDSALLQIALEKENFINQCNQQINQLKAQGRLQEAEILSEWAQAKIERYDADYKWYQELKLSREKMNNDQANFEKEFAFAQDKFNQEYYYNRAVDMLERGALTEDALKVLGVDKAWAKSYADKINESASYSLAYAKAQLDALLTETAILKKELKGSSGGGEKKSGGGAKGGGGGGGGGTPQTVRIYHADGSHTDVTLEADGSVPYDALKDGDTMIDSNGTKYYYDTRTGEWSTTVPKNSKVLNRADWLKSYRSLTGDTGLTKPETAKAKLQRMLNDAVAKRDAIKKEMYALTSQAQTPYPTNNRGDDRYVTVPVKNQAKYEQLKRQYDNYDRRAGSYATLIGKYPH